MAKSRSAKVVIDNAIADNLWWERLCYGLILVFVATGIVVIFVGIAHNDGLISLSGTGLAALFWPSISYATKLRRENVRIRLYELPLAEAKTAVRFSEILREVFDRPLKGK